MTVLGAADSSFARNWYGPAVIRMVESVIFGLKGIARRREVSVVILRAFKGGGS